MIRLKLVLAVVASSFCVVACAPTEAPISSESDIQGGAVDRADPAVGLVWLIDDLCTGTLIAPNTVLTAAHCVKDPVEGFYTGTGRPASVLGEKTVKGLTRHVVAEQVAHPSFRKSACPNATFDLGLIRLDKPLVGVTPVKITAGSAPQIGATCKGVGFGLHTEGGNSSFAQKRAGTQIVQALGPSTILVKMGTALADSGDSGGPLICDGVIVGATSCHNDGRYPQTHELEYYARLDPELAWVKQKIAEWNP
jgi:secreted trypsin-like serine protease